MSTHERISRFLAMFVVVVLIATQIIALGTATFAGNRETEYMATPIIEPEINHYPEPKLEKLAHQYQVDIAYLKYIAEVEKQFGLEPFELCALIAQESEFKPKTHMDGGSYSYSTTQMKLPTARTAHMALKEYYAVEAPEPTHDLMSNDIYYATLLAGAYLKYMHDVYKNKYESLTAYRWGINGRLEYFKKNGHYESPYAKKVIDLRNTFANI